MPLANAEQRDFSQQFALYHSNPAWVELSQCRYVTCVEIDKPILRRGLVNSLDIPAGLHAVFALEVKNGELLPQLTKILQDWLPQSGFKMQSTPTFVHYKKNQFLNQDEIFKLDFCLPISLY
jgi:AraC family transcriptional regulator